MILSSPNRPSGDPHYFGFFSHVSASQKNIVHELLDFSKKSFRSISPKITQKTENDTVGRYRFGENLDIKFYARKQILSAMCESKRGFGFQYMRK